MEGARKFALGFLYKAVFADNLAAAVNTIFSKLYEQTPLSVFGGCLGFYGQIYFDFAGYSLMAIGVANLLGYTLPDNFNFPYRATSLIDFWRRWHISLSTWLRDYVYIPLGGNRGNTFLQYRNIMITMFLGGLWHGANWNFVLWGGGHGLALCCNHAYRALQQKLGKPLVKNSLVLKIVGWLLTQGIVFCCWIPFRAASLKDTFFIFHQLSALMSVTFSSFAQATTFPWLLALFPLFFDMLFNGSEYLRNRWSIRSTRALTVAIALGCSIGLLFMHRGIINFIYFQF
jgi:D-alanyl-lipoteichoic acid acyltransferase DltB (MBOAT superfamily)